MLLAGKYGNKMYSTSSQGQYGQYTIPLAVYESGKMYSSMIIKYICTLHTTMRSSFEFVDNDSQWTEAWHNTYLT